MSVRLPAFKISWSSLPQWRVILGLLLIPLVPALVSAWVNPLGSLGAREGEASVVVAQGWPEVLWVDARAEAAYAQDHVPGAVNLSPRSWDGQVGAVIAAWRPERRIVVYCDGHGCQASRDVAQRLRSEMGLTEVYVLTGGWDAWTGGRK